MSTTKQPQAEVHELLADLEYINQRTKEAIQDIGEQIRLRIANEQLPKEIANTLIADVSNQLGKITAKVNLTAYAISSMQQENALKVNLKSPKEDINQLTNLFFTAGQLQKTKNLLPVESAPNNITYCWSGDSPELDFSFSLDRNCVLSMQIRLFALIKPEFLKQLKVLVNDNHIKHSFTVDGVFVVVHCILPPSNRTTPTEVTIILPDTHSPMELGDSEDARKLGIAINEIRFGKPDSAFFHILKRLNLKK